MERRTFLTAMGGAERIGEGGGHPPASASQHFFTNRPGPQESVRGRMRYRKFGRHNDEISGLGGGGFHVGSPKDRNESTRIIRTAIDAGATFMDNCWDYHDG